MYWLNTDDSITEYFSLFINRIREIKSNDENRIIKLWTKDVPFSVMYCLNIAYYSITESFFIVNESIRETKFKGCQVLSNVRCKWIKIEILSS